jgi:hypothetical protein
MKKKKKEKVGVLYTKSEMVIWSQALSYKPTTDSAS